MLSGMTNENTNASKYRNRKMFSIDQVNNLLRLIYERIDTTQIGLFKEPGSAKCVKSLKRAIFNHLGAVNPEEYTKLEEVFDTTIEELKQEKRLNKAEIQYILATLAKKSIFHGDIIRETDAKSGACWTIFLSQLKQITKKHAAHFDDLKKYNRFKEGKTYKRNDFITQDFQDAYLMFMGQLEKNGDRSSVQAIHTFFHILYNILIAETLRNADTQITDPYNYIATNVPTCLLIGLRLDFKIWSLPDNLSDETLNIVRLIEYDFMSCFIYAVMHLDVLKEPYTGRNYKAWQQDSNSFDALSKETTEFMWKAPSSPLFVANNHQDHSVLSKMKSILHPFKLLSLSDHPKDHTNQNEKKVTAKQEKEKEQRKEKKEKARPIDRRKLLKRQPKSDTALITLPPRPMNESAEIIAREGLSPRSQAGPQPPLLYRMPTPSLRNLSDPAYPSSSSYSQSQVTSPRKRITRQEHSPSEDTEKHTQLPTVCAKTQDGQNQDAYSQSKKNKNTG
ncbi:MAG: hypothetical protein BGO43_08400 [Gammaproteobacteria bacterium 39-13]|nr:hypothetical protein [Gammaproteobacteria bacterium]OJV96471.1 MAG: hypothetical protein BGO43_08400 [Gammaproteobacteria bacterium 39-13]